MFNSPITITGRIVEDPTYYVNKDNTDGVLRLRIASSRSFLKEQEWKNLDQLYITVEAWGRLGINAHQALLKGTAVIIHGTLYTNSWKVPAPEGESPDKESSRQEIRLRASSIGVDMNYYKVGFKDARPLLESNLHGVEIPGGDGETYPDVSRRTQVERKDPAAETTPEPAPDATSETSNPAAASAPGSITAQTSVPDSETKQEQTGKPHRELVGATARAGNTNPPF